MPTRSQKAQLNAPLYVDTNRTAWARLGTHLWESREKTQELGNPKGDACILISAEKHSAPLRGESEKATRRPAREV